MMVSFADDLKLFAASRTQLLTMFDHLELYLHSFGLRVKITECSLVAINSSISSLMLRDVELPCLDSLRFLGLRINAAGEFLPWRDSYDDALHALHARLTSVGLGGHPAAFMKAVAVQLLPAMTFGGEIWGLSHVFDVITAFDSPYTHPRLRPLV